MKTVKKVQEWSQKIGQNEAYIRLLRAGLSQSLVDKLIYGTYPSEPGRLVLKAIDEAMKK